MGERTAGENLHEERDLFWEVWGFAGLAHPLCAQTVSYTHLTLPTTILV